MKQILYVDMDNVLVDFRSALPHLPPGLEEGYEGHLDDVPVIFSFMDPMPGALAAEAWATSQPSWSATRVV